MLSARSRLSVMMFLQYFVWGSWAVSAGGYMGKTLQFDGPSIGLIYSTTAIGAIFAPLFVGYIADRFFATERILATLHIVGGALLVGASYQTRVQPLFQIMVGYALCYMPTLALTNSISMANIGDPEKEFPRIRVFGTLGWIAAGLIVGILMGEESSAFFKMAGGASVVLGVFCLALPHTPPRGASGGDALGLGAIKLFKEPSFTVFAICSFLICIPLAFYYGFANTFLVETDRPAPTALQTLGQISEVFFMAAMPWFIVRLGVKYMLLVGMGAWVVRYLCFSTLDFSLLLVGLVLHGICYDFFFVASQIYVDKKAPRDMRASAQSLIAFITLGLGMFVGSNVSGWIVNQYPELKIEATSRDGQVIAAASLPNWAATESQDSAWKYLDLKSTVRGLLFDEKQEASKHGPDFAAVNDTNGDGKLQVAEIPDQWIERPNVDDPNLDVTYSGTALRAAFAQLDPNSEGVITRAQWRAAQAHDWSKIWIWPALMAGVTCLLFWIGFHDRVQAVD
ncbi:MAG TPA: nucleoside permease [Pirellulales bacterium]|jgi:nucleoside transporter